MCVMGQPSGQVVRSIVHGRLPPTRTQTHTCAHTITYDTYIQHSLSHTHTHTHTHTHIQHAPHTHTHQNAFFEEVGVNSLKYLDMLYQRGDMEKSQFFKKNLARVITKLPKVGYGGWLLSVSNEIHSWCNTQYQP